MYLHDKDKIKIIIALHLLEIVVKYCIAINEVKDASDELKAKIEVNKKTKELLVAKTINQINKITSDKLSRRASRIIQEMGIIDWIRQNHSKTQVAREFMIIIKFFFELITIPQEDIRQEVEDVFAVLLEYENKQEYSVIIKDNETKMIKIGKNEFNKIVERAEKQATIFFEKMLEILN